MKDKQLKSTTYVDNPPVKDNITKTTFQIRFSKSNFMFIGKWIIAFVLVVVLGSQALNGFISSKFTKDSTTETIVHEYKKQIGTEIISGKIPYYNDLTSVNEFIVDTPIKVNNDIIVPNDFINFSSSYSNGALFFGGYYDIYLYDSDNNLINYFNNKLFEINIYWQVLSNPNRVIFTYSFIRFNSSNAYAVFWNYNPNSFTNNSNIDYFVLNSLPNSSFDRLYSNTNYTYNINGAIDFFNNILLFDSSEVPIYETTTYTYEIKDNNYNWDLKLKQLSAFKPLFKFNQSFINEEYVKYNNLISYEYVNTSAGIGQLVTKYKEDERLKPLFDNNYLIINGKTESGIFKDKTKFYSYLSFNFPLDYDIEGVSSAYNWVIDNYVTDFNIDSYLNESKYKVELKDLLEIFKFPIQIVNNLVYDFGVLVGFITWW